MKFDKGTAVRCVMFALAWINNILAAKGIKTIPVLDESQVAMGLTIVVTAYTFYKDNFKGKKVKDIEKELVKDSASVIEKVVEAKVEAKPVVIPVAPSNQPIQPAPVVSVAPAQPVAQPVQSTAPTQESK